MNEQPTHGIRVRFDLQRGSDDVATYDVTVYEPDHRFGLVASLDSASGHVSLAPAGEKTPGWVAACVMPFAKQILSARRGGGAGVWPRRVLRWRAPRE